MSEFVSASRDGNPVVSCPLKTESKKGTDVKRHLPLCDSKTENRIARVLLEYRNLSPNGAWLTAKQPLQCDPVKNENLAKSIAAVSDQLVALRTELKIAQSLVGQWKVLLCGFLLGILASVIASFIYAALV